MMPEAIFDNIKTFELSCLKLHTKHNQSWYTKISLSGEFAAINTGNVGKDYSVQSFE